MVVAVVVIAVPSVDVGGRVGSLASYEECFGWHAVCLGDYVRSLGSYAGSLGSYVEKMKASDFITFFSC